MADRGDENDDVEGTWHFFRESTRKAAEVWGKKVKGGEEGEVALCGQKKTEKAVKNQEGGMYDDSAIKFAMGKLGTG